MTSRSKTIALVLTAFALGVALPAAVIWNPAGWAWADRIVGREASHPAHGSSVPEKKQLWTCGMHPQVIQDKPGNCPICGMRLVPLKDTGASPVASGETAPDGHANETPAAETGVRVDPNFLQNFAVRTEVAEKGSIPIEIRTVGVLAHNPDGLYAINTKFAGWIEKSYFNNVGQHVQRGDLLLEIYSPDLVTTQQEYLAAMHYLERLEEARAYADAVGRARSLLEAARERLRYWDVTDDQIRELEETRKSQRTVKIYSPATGILAEKASESLEGMRIEAGMTIYHLADHSRLLAEVELYEHQIQYLREGMAVRVEVEAFPGRVWRGRIVRFAPSVNPQTRTLRASVEVENKDQKLRPEMWANILVEPPAVTGAVKVPDQAILHSGTRSVVVVQKAAGLFEPREVELGPAGGGYQEVRRGLEAGETIVTSSQFLIDSESNLKVAIQQLLGDRRGDEGEPSPKPALTHQH
jgi:RND family efflux transporter MFP subunit